MSYLKKIFAIIIIGALVLTGCSSSNYKDEVEIGAEFPMEMFPIYKDATVYKYEFDKGIIDISFGTEDSYDKVSQYYDLLFEHSKYDVTAEKMTNQRYVTAGKTNLYKYLLEVNKSVFRKEKKLYNTIVNLRVTINDFVVDNTFDITPTPEPVIKFTPAPTNTLAPTDTPKPTNTPRIFDDEVISTADVVEDKIFIECLGVEEYIKGDGQKILSIKLKMINYGQEETGYISISDFVLIDEDGISYHSDMVDGLFASGVNILPGGYCIDSIRFAISEDAIYSVLAMPEGLGDRVTNSYDLELAPLMPPMDAGAYDEAINEVYDISHIPTFIIGQEYVIDNTLTTKLNGAEYFNNHTTTNADNLMYTFSMEFSNISETVIIPVEIRDFVLFDIKHNIMIKPTVDLTPYDELAFNPVQDGLSENYNISFDVFEEVSENHMCLMLISPNQQDNLVIYKIR